MKAIRMQAIPQPRQRGFTIIELVVVILLLGILAATALPRFIDVTDDAHQSAVEATFGGMSTGTALFRAQWVAEGQSTTSAVTGFDGLFSNSNGAPVGDSQQAAAAASADCDDIFTGVLQSGRPATSTGITVGAGAAATDVSTVADGSQDYVVIYDDNPTPSECQYYYVGQYQDPASSDIPVITMEVTTGELTLGETNF